MLPVRLDQLDTISYVTSFPRLFFLGPYQSCSIALTMLYIAAKYDLKQVGVGSGTN